VIRVHGGLEKSTEPPKKILRSRQAWRILDLEVGSPAGQKGGER